jgi:pyochelin synthetase
VVRQAAIRGDRLVAHLAAAGGDRPGDEDIRQALRQHLPDYMTPAAVIWHDALPLTPNGKVDRAALTELSPPGGRADGAAATTADLSTEATDLERKVCALWASVLCLPVASIARDQDFYDLGGDSLAAARILAAVRKQFGVGITLDRLHLVQTVQTMAAYVAAGAARTAAAGGTG